MSYFLALSSTHGETVVSRYRALRDEKLLCDVVLVAEGTEFRAHRSLLACASDYFRCLFKAHTREAGAAVVQLQLVSAGGLGRVLDFIYTSCLALCPDSLEQTLEAASYLQVPEALRLCSVYLASSLSTAGCCRSANLAADFALPEARRRADLYIASNLWRLLELGAERSGLADLNPDSLGAVLDSERLPGVPEPALLVLALDWLGRGPEPDPERWSHADRLLSRIRYGLVPCAELQRLLLHGGQGAAGRAPGARRLITQAVRYHHAEARQPVRQSRQSTLRSGQRQLVAAGGLLLLPPPPLERPESGEATAATRALCGLSALDPRTGCWRPLADGPRVQGHCVCVLGDFLFVLGGELLAEAADQQQAQAQAGESGNGGPKPMPSRRVFRYDPRSNSWSRAANMLKRRAQFACCVLGERIYALGGRSGAGQASLSAAELLDLGGSGRWLEAAELPQQLHGHACAVHAGTIYVSGGRPAGQAEACKEMHSLAPQAGASWQHCPPMTIARFGHQMATVGERIYSFVGMYEPFCDIECYEPLRAQWQRLRPLIFDRSCYGLAVLDGTVYLVGGKKWQQGREVPAQSTVAYDPASDGWREVCRLPVPLYGAQCGALLLPELPDAQCKPGLQ